MKRWIRGSVAFFVTLGFGLAAAAAVFTIWSTDYPVVKAQIATHSNSNVSANTIVRAAPARTPNEFVAEFRDLPTFDELFPDEPAPRKAEENLIEVLEDGVYRQDEVVAKNGESWLVLVKKADTFSLQTATARVTKLKTVSWPGDVKDAKLSFTVDGKPIFALKNIRALRPGPVPTLFQRGVWDDPDSDRSKPEELSTGYRREFVLNDKKYTLRTSRGITKDSVQVAVLVLESDGLTQVLTQKHHSPSDDRDIIGSLLWAGDLDNDGRLDLYFDEFNEKGFTATELHLSSYSASTTLVGIAARFGMAGC